MMLQPPISPLRQDGFRTLNTNKIISTERPSHSSSAQVFVFTQSGNGLGKAIKQSTGTIKENKGSNL